MCKIDEMLAELNREDLQTIMSKSKTLLDAMRPIHIKELYKKCGKKNCTCAHGSVAEYGHGPYLYVIYTDHDGGQKQRSLGRKMSEEEIEQICGKPFPRWFDFLVTDRQYKKLSRDKNWQVHERELTFDEFEEYYGIPMAEDALGRECKFRYDYQKFDDEFEKWSEMQKVCVSAWANVYGIGTIKSYSIVKSLIEQGYYLV